MTPADDGAAGEAIPARTGAAPSGGWSGRLTLRYRRDTLRGVPRTVVHDRHEGPLRVLQSLYPETPHVCHNVLVHPPGGIVGGDRLAIEIDVGPQAHAFLTTPGATRFYRTVGAVAEQRLVARVADGARLEWLPLETIAYPGCRADNALRFELAPGAETIGWDALALGLPASGLPFERGRFVQSLEWPGRWRERGIVDADTDRRLLDSPLGWAGHRVLGTLWFAAGEALVGARRDALLDAARSVVEADDLAASAGATSPHATLVVLRVLAPRAEPAMALLTRVWRAWRAAAWGLGADLPRVWRT